MTSFFTLLTKCLYSLTPPHEELMTTNDRLTARLLSLSFFLFLSVCVCHTKSFFAFQNNVCDTTLQGSEEALFHKPLFFARRESLANQKLTADSHELTPIDISEDLFGKREGGRTTTNARSNTSEVSYL